MLEPRNTCCPTINFPLYSRTAPVRDNQGKTVIEAGQGLSDAQILGMNWLVEGVQGSVDR